MLFNIEKRKFSNKGNVIYLSFIAPYLLLVSFYTGGMSNFGMKKISAINGSPYDGVAVYLSSNYDHKDCKEIDFELAITNLKHEFHKHLWPWIFLNRIIGYNEMTGNALNPSRARTFKDIKGMDLYNKTGALNSFYNNARLALRIAKKLSSPGIMIDLEAYNNYKTYYLRYLANELGTSRAEVVARLRKVGVTLADLIAQEYPTATIWFTFTGIGTPHMTIELLPHKEYLSVTYIVQGLLQRIKEKNYPITVVSGGLLSLGYCYESLRCMQDTIDQRNEVSYRQPLKAYPALKLAGTIALWKDAQDKEKGYFKKGKCGKSPIQNLPEFKPYLDKLFTFYKYVWIFAGGGVHYNPYDSSIAAEYNRTIKEALEGRH